MIALILPLLNSLLGNIITPFVNAWVSYKTEAMKTGEAGFEVAAKTDAQVMTQALASDVQMAQIKAQTFGQPVVRFMMWVAGGTSAVYFASVILDTLLASHVFFGHPLLGVPKLPPPFDNQVWMIIQSVFLIQAVHVGTSNVTQWLNRK